VTNVADLDLVIKEEQRLKALLSQQEQAVIQTRRELTDVVAAKRVLQRLAGAGQGKGGQHAAPPKSSGNGSADLTVKEVALEALKSVHPRGFENAGIREYAMKKHQKEISSGTLAVMLGRLRDEDGAAQVQDHVWFWVPPDKRKPGR
jgi:hypothetical protein